MNGKTYLNQVRVIERTIHSKVCQLEKLQALAERTTAVLSDVSGERNNHSREDVIDELIDQKDELKKEISELIRTKHEISNVVKRVPNLIQRTILEERYIYLKRWKIISKIVGYSESQIYRFHKEALKTVDKILKEMN